jgi:SepF-like predicted cell division protein (DUF552 family)
MRDMFSKLKDKVVSRDYSYEGEFPDQFSEDYVELDTEFKGSKSKIKVRPFIVEDFVDIKPALDALREGYTIALINIKPLKDRDMIELKRAVGKLKKTCEAIDGDIAGFGEDWLVATPSFASIHRDDELDGALES